jgi:acyl dehydratase
VADTSQAAAVNLGWTEIRLPHPVFIGDTIWSETEVTSVRESGSRPTHGIVGVRTRGINQRREVVCEFARSFLIAKTSSARDSFPGTDEQWNV